jgi:hypothetical protein
MKKLIILFLVIYGFNTTAQNLQIHYDFGKNREYLTTTLEMFKPDKLGNTFFFVDMNYNSDDVEGISLAYWEIARVIKTEKMPIGIHFEYNGGFGQFNADTINIGYRINDAWLAGIDYSINADDFSKGISFKALYKHIRDKHDVSFQLTTVWYINFFNNKLTFSGFADFWKEDSDFNFDGKTDSEYIFISEPQLWYNINAHFSLGSEIEFIHNFANMEGFKIMPTLGAKWMF